MNKTKRICPVCETDTSTGFIGKYTVCLICRTMYLGTPPKGENLQNFIEEDAGNIIHTIVDNSAVNTQEMRLALLGKYIAPNSTILDVGCGNGVFLSVAKKQGYRVSAMDKSKKLVSFIKKTLHIPAYTDFSVMADQYTVITSFDVIEHTTDPNTFIAEIADKLKKNGILMITTPNALGISGRVLKKRWWVFGPEGHYVLFTPKSLQLLLEKYNFSMLSVKTDMITLWFVPNNRLLHKMLNKIIYLLITIIKPYLFSHYLGDNIEIIAQKRI